MITRTVFIASLMALFALSYVRFTWYLDLNLSGRPALVRIHQKAGDHGNEDVSGKASGPVVSEGLRFRSVMQFWILFGSLNMAVLAAFFKNKRSVRIHWVLYLSLSLFSLALFGLWKFMIPEDFLFQTASRLKNFLLTPLYSGLVFIFVKYFDSFAVNRER